MCLFVFTWTTWVLLHVFGVAIISAILAGSGKRDRRWRLEPDGPTPLPVVGSLRLLRGYRVPFEAFRQLALTYGQVFGIKLGSVGCVVVNGLDNIREVLMARGEHFDGRPNFLRYNLIFDGDKRNSLAFCDWSELQKTRRELLRAHTFPQSYSTKFYQLDTHINQEAHSMFAEIAAAGRGPVAFKPILLRACANIFLQHFCGRRYDYRDQSFRQMVRHFDEIFYEVNQGRAVDFMPWLLPFYRSHLDAISTRSKYIREFTTQIVNQRYETWAPGQEMDYIDTLIDTIRREEDKEINLQVALFSLEDIIGGHSAIANFLMKVFAYIVTRGEVQCKIKAEIQSVTKGQRDVRLSDRQLMPYTEAVILEATRLISSPIVPHVASQDSSIAGLTVRKGTLIFLNNFDLNYSSDLWEDPEEFKPERFLNDGYLFKPDHFFPYSLGRRSCMGYKMVQWVAFSIIALTLQKYNLTLAPGSSYNFPIGNLALPSDTFKLSFT